MPATTQSTTQDGRKRTKKTIEEALRWAIRDELPKKRHDPRITAPPPMPMQPMWRAGIFGSTIDCWSREPGMPPAMGDPHPDALVIEAQLTALSEILKRASTNDALCPLDLSPYPIQAEMRGKADLNVLIAAALHATPAWLVTCAIRGSVPDVGDGPMCEPATSDNGKVTIWLTVSREAGIGPDGEPWFVTADERTAPTRAGQYPTGAFCKLSWTRGGLEVVEEQLRYAFWHAALAYLVPALQFLDSIEILPPSAAIAPWIERPEQPAAPLPSLRPARQVNLKQRRPAGRRAPPPRNSPVRKIDPRDWTPNDLRA